MKRTMVLLASIVGLLIGLSGCKKANNAPSTRSPSPRTTKQAAPPTSAGVSYKLVLASEVKWEQLNPARGDKSPQAADVWGGRKKPGATGFLVKFVDGFQSPPHIHNVSYRGVVIDGLAHNDDPQAAKMWMPAGSYWTQPKGESHITAAKGKINIAYIEIENGPYLVMPTKKAFDSGERPVNIDPSNIVWQSASSIRWMNSSKAPATTNEPKVAFLWGNPQDAKPSGSYIKLPVGYKGQLRSQGLLLRAVTIQGKLGYQGDTKIASKTLEPGSYFSSTGKAIHKLSCTAGPHCLVYLRVKGKYEITPAQSK